MSAIPMQTQDMNLIVKEITREAEGVLGLTLALPDGGSLPAWTAGAHIDVFLKGGIERHYSLCGNPREADRWHIAVLRETGGRGGSDWVHASVKAGDMLRVVGPRNQFPLVDADAVLFIAGGIGITPIRPMIREANERGMPWRLLYGGRRRASMAFAEELECYGTRVSIRPEDQFGLLDLKTWIGQRPENAAIYACGPERLLDAVIALCEPWGEECLHIERFSPKTGALEGVSEDFEVVLARSGLSCKVSGAETIIDAIDKLGVHVPRSCREGTCGTCLTPVLEGIPDHRDSFLMGKKRAANKSICVCCSRSLTPRLVLDL